MKQVDFRNGSLTGNIFKTALPMVMAQVVSLLYNIVDRVYIGRLPGSGTAALGAIGLCFPVVVIIMAFTNLYGMGGGPLFAIERGKGDPEEADRLMCTSFFLLSATSVLLTVTGELFIPGILRAFGASEEMLSYGVSYMRVYLLGTFFSMVSTGMNPFINAQGFPQAGMITVASGALSNLILDPVFMFVLGMGIQGAALATVISQFISFSLVMSFITGKRCELPLHLIKPADLSMKRILNILGLGTAAFIMQCTNSLVQIVSNITLSGFGGDLYISVMTVLSSVRQILETPMLSIAEGASPVVSFNYGAGRLDNVKAAIRVVTAVVLGYAIVMWIIIMRFPGFFIAIFSSEMSDNPDAIRCLNIYFSAYVFMTFQYCGQTVFKATNKKAQAIFFSLLRKTVIAAPLTILLPRLGWGVHGAFMAEPISNLVGGLSCYITMTAIINLEYRHEKKKGRPDIRT